MHLAGIVADQRASNAAAAAAAEDPVERAWASAAVVAERTADRDC